MDAYRHTRSFSTNKKKTPPPLQLPAMRRVLNVAEKPSMARKITEVLAHRAFTVRDGRNKYCKNFDFTGEILPSRETVHMTMTCVLGHLASIDFEGAAYAGWLSCDPAVLFDAPVVRAVTEAHRSIAQNLTAEARTAQVLVIWTDCDREGEQIGFEISEVCCAANPKLAVYRARYSTVTEAALRAACYALAPLDMQQVAAVQLRMELDLRSGAALTRFLSLLLAKTSAGGGDATRSIISYGSCQFPTLGFVVEQFLKRERFVPEAFYYLEATMTAKGGVQISTLWKRSRLFDRVVTLLLFRRAASAAAAAGNAACVVAFDAKRVTKQRPLPLTTIELQKFATARFRLSAAKVMKHAEDLYNAGLISYPRTETDIFAPSFPLAACVRAQTAHAEWGPVAARIMQQTADGSTIAARRGRQDDGAHPPIHPTGVDAGSVTGDARRIYEFVCRRFLATCSADAVGFERVAEFALGDERFVARGITVLERNFLDAYHPFDVWNDAAIPDFTLGERVPLASLHMQSGCTTAAALLSESQLIATMAANGIGTDATIHDHIQKIVDRAYIVRRPADRRLVPTAVGFALIAAHDAILGACIDECVTRPRLRALLEHSLKAVERGEASPDAERRRFTQIFKRIYAVLDASRHVITQHFAQPPPANVATANDSQNRNSTASKGKARATGSRSAPSKPQQTASRQTTESVSGGGNSATASSTRCFCNLQAKVLESRTAASAGRRFAACPKAYERCKFFAWVDA